MPRIRSLKIGFFQDEVLCDLSPWHRLLFSGLWVIADREGRLEDRPRRIRAEIFPYDDLDVEPLLADLTVHRFIDRYTVSGGKYIRVLNFHRHQLISRDEPASELPGPDGQLTYYEKPPNETVRARVYQRDGFVCLYCGRDMGKTPRVRCVDHVIPYIKGGSHREDNLVSACKACNSKKGGRTPDEAQMTWPQGFGSWLTGCQPPVNGSGQVLEMGIGKREMELGEREIGAADAAGADVAPRLRAEDLSDLWNMVTKPPIPQCRELTAKRRRHAQKRLSEKSLAEWEVVFQRIQASNFCRGENDRGWRASFDWVSGSPDVAVKVLEGKYDNRGPSGPPMSKATASVVEALKRDVTYE